ncbi:MAG: sigma-70 region 4 domain-containing protein [Gemmatales bacterium]
MAGLPEKYRLPLLLCCLQGYTHHEAARQLAWPVGTVAGRLSRAKVLLKKRLLKRGIVISPSVLSVCLAQDALAAMPSEALVTTTMGQLFAGSSVGIGGVVQSPALLSIAQGVVNDLFMTRVMQTLVILAGITLACAGAGFGMLAIVNSSASTQEARLVSATAPLPAGNPRYVHLPADPQAVVLRMTQTDIEGNKPDSELIIRADGRIRGTVYDAGLETTIPLEDRLSPQELQDLMQFTVHDQKVFSLDAPATWKKLKAEYQFDGDLRVPTDTLLTSLEVRTADQQHQLCWSQLGTTEGWFHEVPEVRRLVAVYRRLRHHLILMHAGGPARVHPIVCAVNEELRKTYPRLVDLDCSHLAHFTLGEDGVADRWVFTRGNMFYDPHHLTVHCEVETDGRVRIASFSFGQSVQRPTMKRREAGIPPA